MRPLPLPICLVALLAVGCASTDDCRRPVGDPAITPAVVAASSQGHAGAVVQWGGALVAARNLKESTEFEVVGYPLDRCGRPLAGAAPVGRFVIVRPGYLETADYPPGRQVTATGRLTGIREGRIGASAYRFPLLESYQVHLWPAEQWGGYDGRPWVTIGIGGGSGGVGGGVGVTF